MHDFGVRLITLPPGTWSSQRHWHSHEDELVYVLEGARRRGTGVVERAERVPASAPLA
ncbi:MAG: cupin domain-containing protein [Deltaproteobacteria bacterium]|nr:cupin domain-containing protein [Deltaproteobacteria bacterium]MBW2416433.1 cupin domain-containing protein [Deltaproteobacteria bacterium]